MYHNKQFVMTEIEIKPNESVLPLLQKLSNIFNDKTLSKLTKELSKNNFFFEYMIQIHAIKLSLIRQQKEINNIMFEREKYRKSCTTFLGQCIDKKHQEYLFNIRTNFLQITANISKFMKSVDFVNENERNKTLIGNHFEKINYFIDQAMEFLSIENLC